MLSLPLSYGNSNVAETKYSTANGYEHTKCGKGDKEYFVCHEPWREAQLPVSLRLDYTKYFWLKQKDAFYNNVRNNLGIELEGGISYTYNFINKDYFYNNAKFYFRPGLYFDRIYISPFKIEINKALENKKGDFAEKSSSNTINTSVTLSPEIRLYGKTSNYSSDKNGFSKYLFIRVDNTKLMGTFAQLWHENLVNYSQENTDFLFGIAFGSPRGFEMTAFAGYSHVLGTKNTVGDNSWPKELDFDGGMVKIGLSWKFNLL
jgi:hypothetical protein